MLITVLSVIQVLCCIAIVAVVMLQTGKGGMASAIAGGSDSFMSKGKAAGKEAQLAFKCLRFGRMAPRAAKRTAFQECCRSDPRTILNGKSLNVIKTANWFLYISCSHF